MVDKIIHIATIIVSFSMVAYHLTYTQYLIYSPDEHSNTHLGFALLLVLLSLLRRRKGHWAVTVILILVALITVGYVGYFYDEINRRGYPNTIDIIIGTAMIIMIFEATRRSQGLVLPIVSGIFIAYLFVGQYLIGITSSRLFSFAH